MSLISTAELLHLAAKYILPLVVSGLRSFEQSHKEELHAWLKKEIPSEVWCDMAWGNVSSLLDQTVAACASVASLLETNDPGISDEWADKVVSVVIGAVT